METATYELPYDWAKVMLLVEDIDSKEYLTGLFNKKKQKRGKKR